jgi:hypothetical protein
MRGGAGKDGGGTQPEERRARTNEHGGSDGAQRAHCRVVFGGRSESDLRISLGDNLLLGLTHRSRCDDAAHAGSAYP